MRTELRKAIASLHVLFLEKNGSKWRLKRKDEVYWLAVESFLSIADMDILRCPSLIEYVLSLCRNWCRTDILRQGVLVGRNIALFLCNFCPGLESFRVGEVDGQSQMKCFRILIKKGLECAEAHKNGGRRMWKDDNSVPMLRHRKPSFGAPHFFYRLLSDANPYQLVFQGRRVCDQFAYILSSPRKVSEEAGV